jgi:hypothetical protein
MEIKSKNQAIKEMFNHCQVRAKERYVYYLNRPEYDYLSLMIRKKLNLGINILLFKDISAKHNENWLIFFKGRYFWVIYDSFQEFIITFMPIEDLEHHTHKMLRGTVSVLKQRRLIR